VSALLELGQEECRELLQAGVVGRVAVSTPVGPHIVPVNYAMHGPDVVLRTSPFSELGTHAAGAVVAFEIDHLDFERHQGWSVVVVGKAAFVDDPEEVREIRRTWDPRPWADGPRHLYLKVRPREVTGRRLGDDWTHETLTPVRRTL
jgi:uncharacterized protein